MPQRQQMEKSHSTEKLESTGAAALTVVNAAAATMPRSTSGAAAAAAGSSEATLPLAAVSMRRSSSVPCKRLNSRGSTGKTLLDINELRCRILHGVGKIEKFCGCHIRMVAQVPAIPGSARVRRARAAEEAGAATTGAGRPTASGRRTRRPTCNLWRGYRWKRLRGTPDHVTFLQL